MCLAGLARARQACAWRKRRSACLVFWLICTLSSEPWQVDAGAPVPYGTVLRRTLESDGVLGLFRGSLAAISRNVPHSALVYTIFPHFEQLVIEQRIATPGTFAVRSWG